MSLWKELSHRNVFKVGAAYAIVAWLLIQVAALLFPQLGLPDWTSTFVTVLLLLGFPIALLLAWAFEVTPEGIKRTEHVSSGESIRATTGKRLNFVVGGLLLVALVVLGVDSYRLRSEDAESDSASIVRIAVLPCDNLSPDPNDSYFAPGIHEEIINRLAQLAGIRVTSRSSVLQYAEQRPTIPEIAERLGVDTIMECSVRYQQDQLVMTAQLIDGASDEHLWSESYPGDMSDLRQLFDLQVEMSVDIANEVRVALNAEPTTEIERIPTESREAYEFYLAAKAEPFSDRSIELYRQATRVDPNFFDAWIEMASAQLSMAGGATGAERDAMLVSIHDALDRARNIEPDSWRFAGTESFYFAQIGQWIDAERQLRAAVRLGMPTGLAPAAAVFKYGVGDFAAGVELLADTVAIAPLNAVAIGFSLIGLEITGNADERRAEYARGETLFDDWWGDHVEMYLRLGDGDINFLRTVHYDGFAVSRVWQVAAQYIDTPADALEALRALYNSSDDFSRSPRELSRLAAWAAFFGDPALGLAAITDAVTLQPGEFWVVWFPVMESVRAEPGFEQLLESMGLTEYWDEYGFAGDCNWLSATSIPCD